MPIDEEIPLWIRDYPGGEAIYRYGLAAGIERAAKVADSYEPICDRCPQGCPAAIRALLK